MSFKGYMSAGQSDFYYLLCAMAVHLIFGKHPIRSLEFIQLIGAVLGLHRRRDFITLTLQTQMRYEIHALSIALSVMMAASLGAQGPMRVAPSGRAATEVTLTLVDSAARAAAKPSAIRIDYGQPHLRGRKLLTDSLVPYDKPWRTGANASTTMSTDVDLIVGGKTLPKGKYVLQTLPTRAGWKLLVQKEGTEPPPADSVYNPSNEIARIDLRQSTSAVPLESLTMWLIPSRGPGTPRGQLILAWGNVSLSTDWSVR